MSDAPRIPSKLGFVCPQPTPDLRRLVEAGCRAVKLVESFELAVEVASVNPNVILIGRVHSPDYTFDAPDSLFRSGQRPIETARKFIESQRERYRSASMIKLWEGPNEPLIRESGEMRWYADFEAERLRLLSDLGLRGVVGNFASGTPEIHFWKEFASALDACRKYNGVLGVHEYSSPWMWGGVDTSGEGWTTLRYRRAYRETLQPMGFGDVPLLITECGLGETGAAQKGVTNGPWRNHLEWWRSWDGSSDPIDYWRGDERSPERYYAEQLEWYDGELQRDPFVIGACIFILGGRSSTGWEQYDIAATKVVEHLAEYFRAGPAQKQETPPAAQAAEQKTTEPPAPTVGTVRGAGNDQTQAVEDKLGFKHYVEAFADLIESPYTQPPLTIGIFGSWGMGKSFLLDHLKAALDDRRAERNGKPPDDPPIPRVHIVDFNAWEYNAAEVVWPGLVRKIIDQVEREINWGAFGMFSVRLARNVGRQLKQAQGKLIVATAILLAIVVIAVWQFNLDWALVSKIFIALGAGGLLKLILDALSTPWSKWITDLFQFADYGKQIGAMAEIRADIDLINAKLAKENSRILVIIDDLDRCEPEKAVEVLQAIKLLLNFERFIVCIGIDARVITRAVEKHYKDLLGPAGTSGYEYLDKIVQIPFRIPEPTSDEIKEFLDKQLAETKKGVEAAREAIRQPTRFRAVQRPAGATPTQLPPVTQGAEGASLTTPGATPSPAIANIAPPKTEPVETPKAVPLVVFADPEAAAFKEIARFLRPNPRHLKRLINVYRLVRTLAERKGEQAITVDPVTTIRWLVICGQWPYTVHAMLEYYDQMLEDIEEKKLPALPEGDPLLYLFEKAPGGRHFSRERQEILDHDIDLLRQLLNLTKNRIDWKRLDTIRKYTINFNPAIEAELKAAGSPATPPAK